MHSGISAGQSTHKTPLMHPPESGRVKSHPGILTVLCEKRTLNWNMYSGCDWWRFTRTQVQKSTDKNAYWETAPVSRVFCIPALPGPVIVCPVPDCFHLCPITCTVPVYLNPVCLIPQCWCVLFRTIVIVRVWPVIVYDWVKKIKVSVERCWRLGLLSLSLATTVVTICFKRLRASPSSSKPSS